MRIHQLIAMVLGTVALTTTGSSCGQRSEEGRSLSAPDVRAALRKDAPPELQAIRADANRLMPGGLDALEERIASLRGTPIVINFWASWCGPCRHEFPFFRSQALAHGDSVAFLGVDEVDSEDAARTFLEEQPLPYPSYVDEGGQLSDAEIAKQFDVAPGLPNTVFLDDDGQVAFHWRGAYAHEEDLAGQIATHLGH